MTPAEHGQDRWTIHVCAACEFMVSHALASNCPNCIDGVMEAVEVVPADRERALVEAGNNVISDLERQGSVTSAHYNALRAALDRIQEGR